MGLNNVIALMLNNHIIFWVFIMAGKTFGLTLGLTKDDIWWKQRKKKTGGFIFYVHDLNELAWYNLFLVHEKSLKIDGCDACAAAERNAAFKVSTSDTEW